MSYSGEPAEFAHAVRSHWTVEAIHLTLDVSYNDDHSRIRKGNGAENLWTVRRIAINILKRIPGKGSIPQKNIMCSHDPAYLLKGLTSLGIRCESRDLWGLIIAPLCRAKVMPMD